MYFVMQFFFFGSKFIGWFMGLFLMRYGIQRVEEKLIKNFFLLFGCMCCFLTSFSGCLEVWRLMRKQV